MKVVRIEVFAADIPFRLKFSHSLKERISSESIIVRLALDSGHVGYGEGLPREYVTHETVASAAALISSAITPYLCAQEFSGAEEALSCISRLGEAVTGCGGAAQCAVELAFLDAVGKLTGKPVIDLFGGAKRKVVFYTGVVSGGTSISAVKYGIMYKLLGMKYIKIKVGSAEDIKRLAIVSRIAGRDVDLRVDANCAWTLDRARKIIPEMKRYGVKAVEQPLRPDDLDGMARLTSEMGVDIIADESLLSVDDAKRLAELKACSAFNIRISKCGGFYNALRIKRNSRFCRDKMPDRLSGRGNVDIIIGRPGARHVMA